MIGSAPFFIFGCPRSGTSLLSRMLGSHPRIGVPYESHIFNTFHPWMKHYGDLSDPARCARLIDDILATDVMRDWRPRLTRGAVLPRVRSFSLGGVMEAIMQAWIVQTGKARWGEKTPHHAFYWAELAQAFPDAKIIHIVRDGRDVALSLVRVRFGPKTVYGAAHMWRRYLTEIRAISQSKARVHKIYYEALVTDPEAVLRGVCGFLGEDYDPSMVRFHHQSHPYPTDPRNMLNLVRPVISNNCGKWKTEMAEDDLEAFEAVARDTLVRFGYEPVTTCRLVSKPRHAWYAAKGAVLKGWAMLNNTKGHRDVWARGLIRLRLMAWRDADRSAA